MPGKTTTPVSPEEMAQIRELKVAHFCNLAMCHMKHGPKYAKAKDNCTKALALDPDNVKGTAHGACESRGVVARAERSFAFPRRGAALFRRGKCYAQLGGLDEAKADFDRVLELQPDNRDAARELRALRGAFEKQRKKEQRKFAGMFDKLQQDDEMEAAAAAASAPAAADASVSSAQAADTSISHDLSDASSLVEPALMPKDALSGANAADIGERVGDPQTFEPQGEP